jgi:hypothetical protein
LFELLAIGPQTGSLMAFIFSTPIVNEPFSNVGGGLKGKSAIPLHGHIKF